MTDGKGVLVPAALLADGLQKIHFVGMLTLGGVGLLETVRGETKKEEACLSFSMRGPEANVSTRACESGEGAESLGAYRHQAA